MGEFTISTKDIFEYRIEPAMHSDFTAANGFYHCGSTQEESDKLVC
jgi:hypothetical protein